MKDVLKTMPSAVNPLLLALISWPVAIVLMAIATGVSISNPWASDDTAALYLFAGVAYLVAIVAGATAAYRLVVLIDYAIRWYLVDSYER
jgi:hypothetical protein